jgi:hypothetical protein
VSILPEDLVGHAPSRQLLPARHIPINLRTNLVPSPFQFVKRCHLPSRTPVSSDSGR